MKSLNCARNSRSAPARFLVRRVFSPNFSSRSAACCSPSPSSEVCNSDKTASAEREWNARICTSACFCYRLLYSRAASVMRAIPRGRGNCVSAMRKRGGSLCPPAHVPLPSGSSAHFRIKITSQKRLTGEPFLISYFANNTSLKHYRWKPEKIYSAISRSCTDSSSAMYLWRLLARRRNVDGAIPLLFDKLMHLVGLFGKALCTHARSIYIDFFHFHKKFHNKRYRPLRAYCT